MTTSLDYLAIEEAIAAHLKADPDLRLLSPEVVVEEVVEIGDGPRIGIFLERRSAPDDLQTICNGQRTRMVLQISIMCFEFGLEIKSAIRSVGKLIGHVEVALMRATNIYPFFGLEEVNSFVLSGGEFDWARDDNGFNVGAEVTLMVDVTARTQ